MANVKFVVKQCFTVAFILTKIRKQSKMSAEEIENDIKKLKSLLAIQLESLAAPNGK